MSDPEAAIVGAARECFARFGVHRTRMEDVAAAAGVSRQSVYNYIGGRERLIELALIERCREFKEQVLARNGGEPDAASVEDAIVEVLAAAIELGRVDAEFVYLAEALPRLQLNVILTGPGSAMHQIVGEALGPALERAREEGRLRDDVTRDDMIEWAQGVMAQLTPRDDMDADRLRHMLRRFALPALLR